jgi:hypothetical protein
MEIADVTCMFAGIFLAPPTIGGQTVQKPPLELAVEQGYLTGADGVRLVYRKLGSGSDFVVFLHGGPGASYQLTSLGRRVAALFTKAYGRVLAPGLKRTGSAPARGGDGTQCSR